MRRRKTKYDVGHQDANGRVRSGHCTPHTLITPVCLSIHTPSHTLITPLTTPSPHPSLHPSPHPFPHVPGGQLSIRVIRNIFAHTSHQHTSHQHTSHQHTYLSCTYYCPLWYASSLGSPIQPPQGSAVPVFMAIDDEKETTFGRDEAQPKKGTLSSAHMGSSVHTYT